MRAPLKLVWVSFCLLCEMCGVWTFAQGYNGYSATQRPVTENAGNLGAQPRVSRRDTNAVEGWPSFADAPTPAPTTQATSSQSTADVNRSALQAKGLEQFDLAKTLAQVGDQYILRGELVADANLLLMKEFARLEQLSPEQQNEARSALLANRELLVDQLLEQAIDRKLMYLEFLRDMPSGQDQKKMDENWKKIRKSAGEYFVKELTETAKKLREAGPDQYPALARKDSQLFRLGLIMKDLNIESPDDPQLERVLRENGTSLQSQQQAFLERVLGKQAVMKKVNLNPEITHEQMLAYYRDHIEESHVQTRARWEQLTVLFSRCKNKYEAGDLIANMGNQVLWGGTQFWAVARKYSQEKNAEKGGYHDWTTLGDLRISKELSNAVFTLPIGELSRIIEDDEGLHIIRVLEREEAHTIPFTEAQVDIKQSLKIEALNKAYNEYVAKLREKTPILLAEKGVLPRDDRTRRQ